MKKIQMKAATMAARLCGIGLSLLGFSACSDHPDMYGTPVGSYDQTLKVEGSVSSEDGKSVKNATIEVKYPTGPNSSEIIDKGETNSNGSYNVELTEKNLSGIIRQIRVVCKPDKESGLDADSTDVQLSTTEISKDKFESIATANFHLKKKKP